MVSECHTRKGNDTMTGTSLIEMARPVMKKLTDVLMALAGAALMVMMAATLIDVIARNLGFAIVGVYEISELLMVPTIYFGLPYVQRTGGHAEVDLFFKMIPQRPGHVITILCNLAALGYYYLMITKCFQRAVYVIQRAERSALLAVPTWVLYAIICLGAGLAFLVIIMDTFDILKGLVQKKPAA